MVADNDGAVTLVDDGYGADDLVDDGDGADDLAGGQGLAGVSRVLGGTGRVEANKIFDDSLEDLDTVVVDSVEDLDDDLGA